MAEFKHIVNVIPLTSVNLGSSQIFTYIVPWKLQDQIRPGQLVSVPFGPRKILGVTSSMEMHRLSAETRGLKALEELLSPVPVCPEKNLALANFLANFYVAPLGLVVKAMLPKFGAKSKDPAMVGYEKFNPDYILTEYQKIALAQISNSYGTPKTWLLHGITGSGKTEVYMQVISRVLESGQQVMILVPEISLTAQSLERFARRFGVEKIALLHSRLKPSERLWMWEKIRTGEKQIIVGARSAVFAPVKNLGLIIIDEEHDASFKQYDQSPKYHARTVAKKLSELWSCPLLLGDATPSVETYFAAQSQGAVLNLPHRIMADVGLPKVKTVDMKREIAGGNFSIFSEALKSAMIVSLKQKKQIILFLNRRGAATFVMCRDCGEVLLCKNCSVPTVYHLTDKKLICHHCGQIYFVPEKCPACAGPRIKYFGIGTQAVEEELKKSLTAEYPGKPLPVITRMDRDTTKAAGSTETIYKDWSGGQTQILIGTQMVSKGWDVSRVGLVGIISADTTLHLPDFRSSERTFQVLTQVAGRAGRGSDPGAVILQTYNPENFAIQTAKLHDYEAFYRQEIENRREFGYPPFTKLVKLTIRHADPETAIFKANQVLQKLLKKRETPFEVLGPVPSFIPRVRGKYQFQIILKFFPSQDSDLYSLLQDLPSEIDIDVDPDTLL